MSALSENDVEHQSPLSNSNTRQLRNRIVKSSKKNENGLTSLTVTNPMSARKSLAVCRKIDDDQDENVEIVKTPRSRKTMPSSYKKNDTDNKLNVKIKITDTDVTTPSKKIVDLPKTPKSTKKRQTFSSAIKKTPSTKIDKKTNSTPKHQNQITVTVANTQPAALVADKMPTIDKKVHNISKKTKVHIDPSTSKYEDQKINIDNCSFTISTESAKEEKEATNLSVDDPNKDVKESEMVAVDEIKTDDKKTAKKSGRTKKSKIESSTNKNESQNINIANNSSAISTESEMVTIDEIKDDDKKTAKKSFRTKKSKIESSANKNEKQQINVDNNSSTIFTESDKEQKEPTNLPVDDQNKDVKESEMVIIDEIIADDKKSGRTKKSKIESSTIKNESQKINIDNNSFTISTENDKKQKEPIILFVGEQNAESAIVAADGISFNDNKIDIQSAIAKNIENKSTPSNNLDHKNNIDNSSFTVITETNEIPQELANLSADQQNNERQESTALVIDEIKNDDKKSDDIKIDTTTSNTQDPTNIIHDTSFTISTGPTEEKQSKILIDSTKTDDEMEVAVIPQTEKATSSTNKTDEINNQLFKNNSNEITASVDCKEHRNSINDNKKSIDLIEEISKLNDENDITPLILGDDDDNNDANKNQKTISLDIEVFQINTSLTPLGHNTANKIAEIEQKSEKKIIIDLSDETFNESGIILIPDTPSVIKSEIRSLNETFSPVQSGPTAQAIQQQSSTASTLSSTLSNGLMNTTFSPEKPQIDIADIVDTVIEPPLPTPQSRTQLLLLGSTNTSTPRSPHIKRPIVIDKNSATKSKSIKSLSICRREQTPFKQKSTILSSAQSIQTKFDLINNSLGLISNLKTIRKRSMSVDGQVMESAKKNIRVTFHSPSNNEISIQQIDQIMEESRREICGGGAIGGGGGLRRKRSLSNNDIVHLKDNNDKEKKSTKLIRLPDFASIHKQHFDRMESISEYAQRKAQRSKVLRSGQKSLTKRDEPSRIPVKNKKTEPINKPEAQKSLFNNVAASKAVSSIAAASSSLSNTTITSLPTQTASSLRSKPPIIIKTPSKIKTNPISIIQPATSSLSMINISNFAASLNAPSQLMGTQSSSSSSLSLAAMTKPKSAIINHKEMFKGKTKKTDLTGENKKILKGVRTNRRFELQMKFRQDSEDNN